MSVSDIVVDKDKLLPVSQENISETPPDLQEKVTENVQEKVAVEEDLRNKASEMEKEKLKFHEEKMEFEEKKKKNGI